MKLQVISMILALLFAQSSNSQTPNDNGKSISVSSTSGGKVKGNGEITKEKRNVGDYSKISSSGSINIVLTDGTMGEIVVEAESNLQELVETKNDKGTLSINMKKNASIKTSKNVTVYVPASKITALAISGSGNVSAKADITTSSLEIGLAGSGAIELRNVKTEGFSIKSSGSGNASLQNLDTKQAEIKITGSSDIKMNLNSKQTSVTISGSGGLVLTGKTQDLKVKISGSSDSKMEDLIAQNVDASISGSATITLDVEKSLSANISGSGNILYKGNAKQIKAKTTGSGQIKKM